MSNELTEQALAKAKRIIGDTTLSVLYKVMILKWAVRKGGVDIGYIFRDPDIFEWISKQKPKAISDACKQLDMENKNGI